MLVAAASSTPAAAQGWTRSESMAMFVALAALMPRAFMVVAMMIPVVIPFVRRYDAAHHQTDQPQQKAAFRDSLCIYHAYSSVVTLTD
jgi:hypothetical protein